MWFRRFRKVDEKRFSNLILRVFCIKRMIDDASEFYSLCKVDNFWMSLNSSEAPDFELYADRVVSAFNVTMQAESLVNFLKDKEQAYLKELNKCYPDFFREYNNNYEKYMSEFSIEFDGYSNRYHVAPTFLVQDGCADLGKFCTIADAIFSFFRYQNDLNRKEKNEEEVAARRRMMRLMK